MDDSIMRWDGSAKALAEAIKNGWGNPDNNARRVIPTGLGALDRITYGLMPAYTQEEIADRGGDMWLIEAREGQRKSTLAANIILHAANNPLGVWIGLESAEPGMSPGRWRDILIAMLATHYVVYQYYVNKFLAQTGDHQKSREMAADIHNWKDSPRDVADLPDMGLSADGLRFKRRTPVQQKAIEWAIQQYANLKLRTYGPGPRTGGASSLEALQMRWERDIIERGERVKIIDHLQTIDTGTRGTSDYDRMQRITDFSLDMISKYGICIIVLSQVSLGSERLRIQGLTTDATGRGGSRAEGLANIALRLYYDDPYWLDVHVKKSRRSGRVHLRFPLDPPSGLIIGPGAIVQK